MRVWYKLNDFDVSKVQVADDADVDDLKLAIKEGAWHHELANVSHASMTVSGGGVEPFVKIRDVERLGRTGSDPFVVRVEMPPKNKIPDHFAPLLLELAMKIWRLGGRESVRKGRVWSPWPHKTRLFLITV